MLSQQAYTKAGRLGADLEAQLASKLPAIDIHPAVIIQNVDAVQVVALARGIVIGVMSWSDLHCSSTKAHVYQLGILDDGNLAPVQGMHHKLAVQVLIPACHFESGHTDSAVMVGMQRFIFMTSLRNMQSNNSYVVDVKSS